MRLGGRHSTLWVSPHRPVRRCGQVGGSLDSGFSPTQGQLSHISGGPGPSVGAACRAPGGLQASENSLRKQATRDALWKEGTSWDELWPAGSVWLPVVVRKVNRSPQMGRSSYTSGAL